MTALSRPEVICTHESDLDGLVSGLLLQRLARHLFEVEVPLEAYHYQGWRNRQMEEDAAWVSDFVCEPRHDRPGWLVVDHHSGGITPGRARLIHDPAKSAALLAYELCRQHQLHTPALDRLVHLTNVGDLFLESDPDFALACDYSSLVKSYGFWNLHTVVGGDPERLLDHPLLEVMGVQRRVEDPIGFDLARREVVELSPTVGLVRPAIGNTNLIVHRLLNEGATPYAVLVTFFKRGPGQFIVSFRSRNGEAFKTAGQFEGGGGHPNAAGVTLPRSINDQEAAIAYLRQRLHPSRDADGFNALAGAFSELKWPDR
ncbi:MAG: DHH family phosphoesterase [Verrucomicrobiota bacterium]